MSPPQPSQAFHLGSLPLAMNWSREAFARAEARNPRAYRRGYRHEAITDEELLFPSWPKLRDSFRGQRITDLLGPSRIEWFRQWSRFAGVDLSNEHRPGNIITSIAAEKVRERGGPRRFCLLEVHGSGLNLTQPQVLDHMTGADKRWDWDGVIVETNALQEQVIRWAERVDAPWRRKVRGFTTSSKKWDEVLGLPGLEVEFSRGDWLVPYGEWDSHPKGNCDCGWCRLDSQLSLFTRNGPGTELYDELMSLYFSWEGARSGSLQPEVATINVRSR